MGFGFLFLGYLVSFVLSLTLARFDFAGAAHLLGYALMLRGLMELTRYQKSFLYAKWLTYPMLAIACYSLLGSFDTLLWWNLPIFGENVTQIVEGFTTVLAVCFQAAVLYGIRMLEEEVELSHIATKAVRNMVFLGLYGLLYAVSRLPDSWVGSFVKYVELAEGIVLFVVVALNLLLLISCNKNICAEGDEDQPPKKSRFEWINRMGEAYDRTHQKNIDNAKRDAEEFVRRHREKKEQKKNKKKKK